MVAGRSGAATRPASRARHEAVEDDARPHVVVTDIVMPGLDGIAATAALLAPRPDTRVVLVMVHDDPEVAARGYTAGALAYVSKHSAGHERVPAVRAAMRGERFVSPSAALGAPMTAFQYDWNMLPIGQQLWEVHLLSYAKFQPLQAPETYNLSGILEQVKKANSRTGRLAA